MQLERDLRALAAEIEWPPTPSLRVELPARRRRLARPVLVALAAALVALAVAFAVPQSRAAILRFLHLGAVSIELVDRLPVAEERPLGSDLGPTVAPAAARRALGGTLLLPPLDPPPPIHADAAGIVSLLFLERGEPVLLSEIHGPEGGLIKKIASFQTSVQAVSVGTDSGIWLSGARHLVVFPGAPPRLAGSVLVWQHGSLTLRLEGRALTERDATRIAASLR